MICISCCPVKYNVCETTEQARSRSNRVREPSPVVTPVIEAVAGVPQQPEAAPIEATNVTMPVTLPVPALGSESTTAPKSPEIRLPGSEERPDATHNPQTDNKQPRSIYDYLSSQEPFMAARGVNRADSEMTDISGNCYYL